VYPLVRWKNVLLAMLFYNASRRFPDVVKGLLRRGVERSLPAGYEVTRHFTPRYDPWDQRPCIVPDGDLFDVLRSGQADIVTDTIETFTETGVRLTSGRELEADIIITATGLNLLVLGGIEIIVDGRSVDVPDAVTYKGMMLSGVPNAALALGYTNASWTLKCDLVSHYVCRLLNHMDEHDYAVCTPRAPGPEEPLLPAIDLQSGYVMRSLAALPKQGSRPPWRMYQNYIRDVQLMKRGPLEDEGIRFTPRAAAADRRLPIAA
jgi:cation diffusion facilitator CzcD-associated flavoprotein CzcO